MRKLILALLLLAFLASPCVAQMAMTWDNWVLPNWTPSWSYNTSWTPQNASTFGYTKYTFASNTVPEYVVRRLHYTYTSIQTPGMIVICGPETYLSSNNVCSRNPRYWNPAVAGAYCHPDYLMNYYRISCESTNPGAACCFRSNSVDLLNYDRVATVYPPGS